jgi:hypothetical protein
LPLSESDFLSEEEKEKAKEEKEKANEKKEKAQLDRFIAAAKEKVEKYFEDPSNRCMQLTLVLYENYS